MRSWKRRTRSRHDAEYRKWYNAKSPRINYQPHLKRQIKKWKLFHNQEKRHKEFIRNEIKTKQYFEDCNDHPCRILSIDIEGDDIRGQSLVGGTHTSGCSLSHCGVIFFTEEDAMSRARYITEHGLDVYVDHYDSLSPPAQV